MALVSRYLTNKLMERMPIFNRLIFNKYSHAGPLCYGVLVRFSTGYSPVKGRLHTCYSPVRRSPPSYCYSCAAPRLACVRPIASVHPEPGSNSSLYICCMSWTITNPCCLKKTGKAKNKQKNRKIRWSSNPRFTNLFLFLLCSIERVPIYIFYILLVIKKTYMKIFQRTINCFQYLLVFGKRMQR